MTHYKQNPLMVCGPIEGCPSTGYFSGFMRAFSVETSSNSVEPA